MQDPLIHGYCANSEQDLQLLRKVERETYQNADQMLFLTQQAMLATEKRLSLRGKGKVIYPGANQAAIHKEKTGSTYVPQFTLAHFGSLGGVRNLGAFIEGVRLAIPERLGMVDHISINLYGDIGKDDLHRIMAFTHPTLFSIKGRVTRGVALDAMTQSEILLLIQGKHPISAETIPSKLYEYLHVGRPVLALVHENSEIKQMIEPLAHTCVSMDPDEIAQALITLYDQWLNGALAESHPSPYSVKNAVTAIVKLM